MNLKLASRKLRILIIMAPLFSNAEPNSAQEPIPRASSLTNPVRLGTHALHLAVSSDDGRYEIADRRGGVVWESNPYKRRFGEIVLNVAGKKQALDLSQCKIKDSPKSLEMTFHPLGAKGDDWFRVTVAATEDGNGLEFSYEAAATLPVESVRLLDDALWVTDADKGCAAVPVREGLLVPADSGLAFTHSFDTYAYEGCHMAMLGLVKNGATAMLTWDDPYTAAELRSALHLPGQGPSKQVVSASLVLRKSARSFTLGFCGRGDYVTIARAYRQIAKEKGWLVTWDQKLKANPDRAKLFGASNFKLWSTLSRTMNEESTKEEKSRVNWTFDEAAQVAEHLKNDLKMDKVLFIMGGWIRRGYDNQHPDILPSAPECGGDEAFARCCKRVRALGYVLSLHDNYQDMYRDAPSWDESFLMRHADGGIAKGGRWAGGRAYLTCSRKAVELAKRPQNLPAVKKLTDADSYFIDTTYAAGLQECFDPNHPLTRRDDMKWKQAISDYARGVFGIFGSECGREWAIPHSDFFEGLTGVSGRYYHDEGLLRKLGGTSVPLFEIVYRDSIAMYGKYGYDIWGASEYVLHHISIGRPLNYHSVPAHLYWKEPQPDAAPLGVLPAVTEVKKTGPRTFTIAYAWKVEKAPGGEWTVFVHFTDAAGKILFQNDHAPDWPTSRWQAGEIRQGPLTVSVPEGLTGTFDIRMGLFQKEKDARARILGPRDREGRTLVGQLKIAGERIEFLPPGTKGVATPAGDPAIFVRADGGWAEGMHPMDRFVKNTHEVLSPLNEITSRMPMTAQGFLSPDRKVILSAFGDGPETVQVIVNLGVADYRWKSKVGGEGVVLPPYGFLIESSSFVAFCARSWNGMTYDSPTLFTLRSLDGKPLYESARVRVFHGFGDPRIKLGAVERKVEKEATLSLRGEQ